MIVAAVVDLEHQVKRRLTSDFSTVNLLFLSLLKLSAFSERKALSSLPLKMESYNVAGELKHKKVVWNSEKDLFLCPLELIILLDYYGFMHILHVLISYLTLCFSIFSIISLFSLFLDHYSS